MLNKMKTRLQWKKTSFFIAGTKCGKPSAIKTEGYVRNGVCLHKNENEHWTISHLGTGHKFFSTYVDKYLTMIIALELSDFANWNFNQLPIGEGTEHDKTLHKLVKSVFEKYDAEGVVYQGKRGVDDNRNQVAASAAFELNKKLMA